MLYGTTAASTDVGGVPAVMLTAEYSLAMMFTDVRMCQHHYIRCWCMLPLLPRPVSIIIIIDNDINASSTGASGEKKLFINCFRSRTSTSATKNWRKDNVDVCYPWYIYLLQANTRQSFHIWYPQYTQFLCLVYIIHNFHMRYPWYVIYACWIHDKLCNIFARYQWYALFVWYRWYTIIMSLLGFCFYVLWIASHEIFPYLIFEESATLVYWSCHVPKSMTTTRLCPTSWSDCIPCISLPNAVTHTRPDS